MGVKTTKYNMNIRLIENKGTFIAEVTSDKIFINNPQDALDCMMSCLYQDAESIIWHQKNIHPDFFDLKTKLAGEVLQKFSNYKARLAIVGDFDNLESKSLRDFVFESNKQKRTVFVSSVQEAIEIFKT